MADEPRRSGRATKGQHKNLELVQDTPTKKSKAKAQAKDKATKASAEPTPAPSDEEEIIRCICGEYEEEEDIERDMICCDQCSAWQHNDCMGLSFAKGEEPAEYFCEQCKPENHKVLLEKIARGERPWEEAAKRRQQQIEEKKTVRRKKGKRGKKGGARPSDVKAETSTASTPAPTETSARPDEDSLQVNSQPPSNQKRKFDEQKESTTPDVGPKQKQQKVSVTTKSTDQGNRASPAQPRKPSVAEATSRKGSVVDNETTEASWIPEEIENSARKSCAKALVKFFVDLIRDAEKQGAYKLPTGKTMDDIGRPLGLAIEHAMFVNLCGGSGEPNEQYKIQLRTILFNVKKNSSLRDRLLVGSLAPDTLATMSTQDMASKEQQQKDAEIKREAEKQHIIIQEQGPRIRRTHKGEEVVEGDAQAGASESIFSSAAAHRAAAEADGSSPDSPTTARDASPKKPGSLAADSDKKAEGKDGADFHGDTGRPQSPGGTILDDRLFPEAPTHLHQPLPSGGKVQADEEIDNLLKDEDAESPPYSPKDYESGGLIWRGKVSMNPVAEFKSGAKYVGGADLSGRISWSQMIPSPLVIDGRIDVQLASNYLCGLRFSNSTDVTVVSMNAPDLPADRTEFDKLFDYFTDRKRYGVIGKHPLSAVKDTYIIPVEAGASKKPEFIELLENNSIEDPLPDRILLVVFVVKTNDHSSATPSEQPTPSHPSQDIDHPMAIASPLTATPLAHHSQYATPTPAIRSGSQASAPLTNMSNSPPPFGAVAASHQPPQQAGHNPSYPQIPPQQQQLQLLGSAAAAHVLGPQAKAPAIQELLQKAPNADVTQMNIIRELISRNPNTAHDYPLLMQAIRQYTAPPTNGQAGPGSQPS